MDGLYRALGISAGGEFSSEDVSLIYRKVFHYPSTTDDVLVAMKKVNQYGWMHVFACVVLFVMEYASHNPQVHFCLRTLISISLY